MTLAHWLAQRTFGEAMCTLIVVFVGTAWIIAAIRGSGK